MLRSVCVLLVGYTEGPETLLSKGSFYTGTAVSTVEPVTGLAGSLCLPVPLQYGLSLGLLPPHPTSWEGWRASADYLESILTVSSTPPSHRWLGPMVSVVSLFPQLHRPCSPRMAQPHTPLFG